MFDDKEHIKQKLQEFLDDEIDEIKQNKIRFFALIFSFLISLALLFYGDSDESIVVGKADTVQIEENSDVVPEKKAENDKESSNNRVIHVKKDSKSAKGEKVIPVIGANSEDKIYVEDPFQSYEEKPAETPPKTQTKIPNQEVIPQQVPIIPPQSVTIPVQNQISDLPPIPNLPPIPDVTPTIQEVAKLPEKELILTGTAINFENKAAIIKKVSTVQGGKQREENLILGVGDSIEGHKIIDITSEDVIFADGYEVTSNYLRGGNSSISIEKEEIETSDIPVEPAEIPINPVNIPEYALPAPIPDAADTYDKNVVTEEVTSEIPEVEPPNVVSLESEKNYAEVEDDSFDLNESKKLTAFETNTTNIDESLSTTDTENSTVTLTNAEFSVDAQNYAFVASDSSP